MQPTTTHPEANGAPVPPPVTPPKNTRNKKLAFIGGGIGLLLLLVVAICVYLFWYQNPQKVVTDAVMNLVKAEQIGLQGDIKISQKDYDITMRLEGEGSQSSGKAELSMKVKAGGMDLKTTANFVVAENGDMYIRMQNLQETADAFYSEVAKSMAGRSVTLEQKEQVESLIKQQFDPVVAKLTDRWIRIDEKELKKTNPELAKSRKCMTEVRTMIRDDKAATNEVASIYKQHQFIRIDEKLAAKDGALGYKVSSDEKIAKEFGEAAKSTKLYKKVDECMGKSDLKDRTAAGSSNTAKEDEAFNSLKVWVNRWSHQLERVAVDGDKDGTKATVDLQFDFMKKPNVEVPQKAASLDEVMKEIDTLLKANPVLAR